MMRSRAAVVAEVEQLREELQELTVANSEERCPGVNPMRQGRIRQIRYLGQLLKSALFLDDRCEPCSPFSFPVTQTSDEKQG